MLVALAHPFVRHAAAVQAAILRQEPLFVPSARPDPFHRTAGLHACNVQVHCSVPPYD